MTYADAVRAIEALEPRGWRLGLDRMQEFCLRADLVPAIDGSRTQFIHVAGTNGKGSTTAFLQAMLDAAGRPAGAFYSPYVAEYRERIQFGGELISEEDLARHTEKLLPIAESLSETEFGGVTKFEFEAGLGFEYWRARGAEWVALEVGLGGRLDATNVVMPACSVIVSIGLDHVNVLGGTLAEIAFEKAGIVKSGVPLVVGQMPLEAQEAVLKVAVSLNSPVWRFGKEVRLEQNGSRYTVRTPVSERTSIELGMEGVMQPHNMALAVAALDASGASISGESIRGGAKRAFAPGRFQRMTWHGRSFVLDGAHNADASSALMKTWKLAFPGRRFHLLTNMISGHDAVDFYRTLVPEALSIHVMPVDFHRALPVEAAISLLRGIHGDVTGYGSASEAMESVVASSEPDEPILVTGSNYVVGEVLRGIGKL